MFNFLGGFASALQFFLFHECVALRARLFSFIFPALTRLGSIISRLRRFTPLPIADDYACSDRMRSRRSYSIPKSFHFLSTCALVFSSIRISSGQGRVKPSVGHLRVASIPILEPKLGRREAWSSESTGPRV